MDGLDISFDPALPASARELLEKYTYGDDDVNLILRFAEKHGLGKDSMVWLLTAILKVNTNLVTTLLRAIGGVEQTVEGTKDWSRAQAAAIQAMGQQLQAQIREERNTTAGQLTQAVADARELTNTLKRVARSLDTAARDFEKTREVFGHLIKADDTDSALAALVEKVTVGAKLEAKHFVLETLADWDIRTNPPPLGLYLLTVLQIALTLAVIVAVLW
ncbi:hypothetical protein [Sphingomonas sp. NPDC079357]|uniref:hypothetical protein n=1 Tax=Sphingomonas sp. NPDC079357 TaxID=3364518 RepID=UPI00384D38B9